MAYCTPDEVRIIANLPSATINDSQLTNLIQKVVTPAINRELSIFVYEETVEFIDGVKENKIDASNTVFYTKNSPLGDLDDDGDMDISDLTVIDIDTTKSPHVRSSLTVSSLDDVLLGKFTLSVAPAQSRTVKVTYRWIPLGIDLTTPDALVKLAAMQLTASMAFMRVDPLMLQNLNTMDVVRVNPAITNHMKQYKESMKELKAMSGMEEKGLGMPPFENLQGVKR